MPIFFVLFELPLFHIYNAYKWKSIRETTTFSRMRNAQNLMEKYKILKIKENSLDVTPLTAND